MKLVASFLAAGILLAVLALAVTGLSWPKQSRIEKASDAQASLEAVYFTMPPIPPPDLTIYFLVETETEAAAIRTQAEEESVTRRRAGLPSAPRVVAVVADAADQLFPAELVQSRLLQSSYGVRYEVVDLRHQ